MRGLGPWPRRAFLARSLAAMAVSPVAALAQVPAYPSRPIQLLVAAPAGGPSDGLARMLSQEMSKHLGQPLLIDNKPGASGVLAAEAAARASPDGYLLMLSWIGNATSQSLLPRLNYDIQRDFAHITQIVEGTNVLVARPDAGFRSLQEFLALARARPGQLAYASAGNGSSGHLAMEMLKQRAGVSIVHIPYRGGAPAMNDLLGGRVDAMYINQDAVIPQMQAGRLVPLAITSRSRNRLLPDVPTVAESGFPGFEATAWAGLSAPRGTPSAVVERLHAAAVQAIQGPMKAKQEGIGARVVGSSPEDYAAFIRSETQKWASVIRAAGIKPD